MNKEPNQKTLKARLRRKLNVLGTDQPFVAGTLVKIERKCGNPNCRCARGGKKHPAHLLTTKVKGKTQSIYVPVDMVEKVEKWCSQYRALKAEMKEVSECCEQLIRVYSKEKRSKAQKKHTPKGA